MSGWENPEGQTESFPTQDIRLRDEPTEVKPPRPRGDWLDMLYDDLPVIAILVLATVALAFVVFAIALAAWALFDLVAG